MKFFEKQRVDLIGTTSVTLQKILIFLMLLSVFTLFNGGLFSFLLCLLGFVGAYKKHTGLLRAYVTISVALMVIAFVFALVATFSVANSEYEYTSSSGEMYAYSKVGAIKSALRSFGGHHGSSSSSSFDASSSSSNKDSSSSSFDASSSSSNKDSSSNAVESSYSVDNYAYSSYNSSSYYDEDYTVFIFLAIVVMVLAFFVVYLKIYSLVLAHRLRKMILLSKESLPTENTHVFTPTNTSCAVPNEHETPAPQVPTSPVFPHPPTPTFTPGFAPYPYPYPYPMMPMMSPQMGGQQMPHHVMFGQQPVFYTYAPMPQPPTDEKL